jgi:hypothetical protein
VRVSRAFAIAALLVSWGGRADVLVDPTYAALRAARPSGEGIGVADVTLERDAHRFTFRKGTLFFLPPVDGRILGAVFLGQGEYELTPATEIERRHLGLVLGEKAALPSVVDTFDTAVLLFTDGTGEELKSHASGRGTAALADAVSAFEGHLKRQRKDYRTNFHVRLLEDLGDGGSGLFLAFFKGRKLPQVLAGYDPLGAERLGLVPLVGGEESFLYVQDESLGDFWYLSPSVGKAQRKIAVHDHPAAHALHYAVDTAVEGGTRIKGQTTIRLVALRPFRALRVQLMARLRVDEAAFSPSEGEPAFRPIPFVQENAEEDADLEVVLPETVAAGQRLLLRVRYAGKDVLHDAGEGNFVVAARQGWYANLGVFTDLATFDLTYRVPKANQVVSVGEKKEERVEGDTRVSRWEAKEPIRVAGFNYGVFKEVSKKDPDSGMAIHVYTNPGTPDVIHEINEALQQSSGGSIGSPVPGGLDVSPYHVNPNFGSQHVSVDTEQLAESALADGVNACRVFTKTFGPIATPRISVTQQSQWSFGQSWPSLVFLPYMAFLDAGTRRDLGLVKTQDFVDLVGLHEMAHQWWGHTVGFESYHDAWLSEGFAEFSAALVVQHTGGINAYRHFFSNARLSILKKRTGADAPAEGGPLSLGVRLVTRHSPAAYQALVYEKGAFVVHMLRMLMQEPGSKDPDAAFEALMKDFVARYSGKNASTADFKALVERHMTGAMNATGDGKMGWFFDQWVDGTEIPTISARLDVKEVAKGRYRIGGTVSQSGVSKEFRSLVPLYLEMANGRLLRFGTAPLIGEKTLPVTLELDLKEKPKRAVANALFDVLARD